jgi:hypothetical protein
VWYLPFREIVAIIRGLVLHGRFGDRVDRFALAQVSLLFLSRLLSHLYQFEHLFASSSCLNEWVHQELFGRRSIQRILR